MQITRIDIEGSAGRYASLARRRSNNAIDVTILTPQEPNGIHQVVPARANEEELWAAARRIQITLDGHRGTNGDIQDYRDVLVRLAD